MDISWGLQTTFYRFAADFGYDLLDYLNCIVPDIHSAEIVPIRSVDDLDIGIGRQGTGSRTMLASPETAAACAVLGRVASVKDLDSRTTMEVL